MVTTAGLGDTLEIRSEHRYDMYDLQIEFPPPPIPRDMTFEVDERTMVDGRVPRAPTTEDIDRLEDELPADAAEAVGVCCLHGPPNGANRPQHTPRTPSVGNTCDTNM